MNLKLSFVITFFIFVNAKAANYDGIITQLNSDIAIKLSTTGKKFNLLALNPEIQNQINKLKNSDFISLEGNLNEEQVTLLVTSVNYVGLKDLIGRWVGNDEFCYTFSDFSSIHIFNKNNNNKCDYKTDHWARDFTYTINPATTDWLVLLSDNQDSFIMDLILHSKSNVDLSLYDPNSGDILKKIKLKR